MAGTRTRHTTLGGKDVASSDSASRISLWGERPFVTVYNSGSSALQVKSASGEVNHLRGDRVIEGTPDLSWGDDGNIQIDPGESRTLHVPTGIRWLDHICNTGNSTTLEWWTGLGSDIVNANVTSGILASLGKNLSDVVYVKVNIGAGATQDLGATVGGSQNAYLLRLYGTMGSAGTLTVADSDGTALTGAMPLGANGGLSLEADNLPIAKSSAGEGIELTTTGGTFDGYAIYVVI